MKYYLNLFSPETYKSFTESDQSISGFRRRQVKAAERISPGDLLICYITKVSRWFGILQIESEPFEDDTPIFLPESDPFVIRFRVKPVVCLPPSRAIPIYEDEIWDQLSFTKGHDKGTSTWTGMLRGSLNRLPTEDGECLEKMLHRQDQDRSREYELSAVDRRKMATHQVRRLDGVVSVSIPEDEEHEDKGDANQVPRESTKIQALLAQIGATMGHRIWLPAADRGPVQKIWNDNSEALIYTLPLNYDETTLRTIEQIDVLWLKGRSIVRAFEVEHTTAIYSGILRMADLLALQPNMDIKLHIVAPEGRKDKVFDEIRRPVFSLLDRGPLSESCTYLAYESVRGIAELKHLSHLSNTVLEEYSEEA